MKKKTQAPHMWLRWKKMTEFLCAQKICDAPCEIIAPGRSQESQLCMAPHTSRFLTECVGSRCFFPVTCVSTTGVCQQNHENFDSAQNCKKSIFGKSQTNTLFQFLMKLMMFRAVLGENSVFSLQFQFFTCVHFSVTSEQNCEIFEQNGL